MMIEFDRMEFVQILSIRVNYYTVGPAIPQSHSDWRRTQLKVKFHTMLDISRTLEPNAL
jgi:hypothetical protein